jgi:D-proline reductase (dithiol) PrdB
VVGLIARNIEKAGVSTVCVSFRKEITELTMPPRIVSTKFSAGKPLGNPGDRKTQRRIIEAGFRLLKSDIKGTTILDPPYKS